MKRALVLVAVLALIPSAFAWNSAGHQTVAGIAWDNMTPQARKNAIALLKSAPADACLLDLFPTDDRPLAAREREFFMRAATWADIIRPETRPNQPPETRACIRYHRPEWHFINQFWRGTSGGAQEDLPKMRVAEPNAVERLTLFRPRVVCNKPACGTTKEIRAMSLAWILHLAGDLHQPLHASARVTDALPEGDRGANLFKLGEGDDAQSLHGFWDGILNGQRRENEPFGDFLDRLVKSIAAKHAKPAALRPGDFEGWGAESYATAKAVVYPATLIEKQPPSDEYKKMTLETSERAIATAGYRLADLLNRMLGG
jgi:S1/P1 Nuclease